MNNKFKLLFTSLCSLGLLVACGTNTSVSNSPSNGSSSNDGSGSISSSQNSSNENSSSENEDPHERDPDDPYRILFLGNSLVFFNDMPKHSKL